MNHQIRLSLFILLTGLFIRPLFSQNQMSVGNNISAITYYSNEWTFTDVYRLSRTWLTRSVGGSEWDSGKFAEVPTDANGYPLSIPFTAASDGLQHIVHTLIPAFSQGNYTLIVQGTGQISIRPPLGGQQQTITLTGGTTVRTVNVPASVTPTQTGNIYPPFLLEIRQSSASDPVRGIKLILPNFYNAATQSETEVFHPLFKQSLARNSLLRFMDFGLTNGSPLQHFSQRTLLTSYTQSSSYGVAAELMADLANELQKDMWICIPHQADDDYVTQLATLLKGRVNAGLKIHIEYSNETWNTIFSQTTYIQDRGQALSLSSDRWQAGQLYVARRSGEIFKIFQDVFGTNDRNRLVFVMSTQNGSTWLTNQRLDGLASPIINPGGVRADALSTAPYITMIKSPTDVCNGTCIPSIDALIAEAQTKITTEITPSVQTMKTLANNNLINLVCYEGGQHIVGLYEALNYQALTDNMTGANHDPRMYGIYTDYLNALKNNGVQMFGNFASCGAWSKYGSWGLLEYQDQSETVAHKYRAIKDWVAANPFTVDALPPSVPTNFRAQKVYDASVKLSWTVSTDNVGVFAYTIYQDGKVVGLTQDTTFLVPNLTPNTAYNFSIRAKDKAINYSLPAQITATTLPTPSALLTCDFMGTTPSNNAVWLPTSVLSPNITYSGIKRAVGIVPATNINDAYGFSINGTANRSTLAESMADSEYVSFKIAPLSNMAMNLNDAKVSLKIQRLSGASPQSYALFSSVKGFEAGKEIYTYTYTNDNDMTVNDVVFYLPENGYKLLSDTIEFRIYVYNAQYGGHRTSFTGFTIGAFSPVTAFPLGSLSVSNLQYNNLSLNWSTNTNLTGFRGYDVYQNGIKLNTTPLSTTTYNVTGLTENLPYIFVIKATDDKDNILFQTQKAYITTPSRNVSYNLINFNAANATTTLSGQRAFVNSGTTNTMAFNTSLSGQIFNSTLKQHQFSGGIQVDYAPNAAITFADVLSLRSGTDGYQPGTLIVSASNSTNPTRLTTLFMWPKNKFLNATTSDAVKFDNTNNSVLSIVINAMSIQNRALRFVIRNGNTYYLSEKLMDVATTQSLSAFANNSDIGKRWGVFDPSTLKMPNPLPSFTAVDFNDVQEVGFIYEGSRTAYSHNLTITNFSVNGLVNPNYVISLELSDFQGFSYDKKNRLTWRFEDTKDLQSVVIERSIDGKIFTPLPKESMISIAIKNEELRIKNGGYVIDENPFYLTYYRLKMNDLDGETHYSKTIALTLVDNKTFKVLSVSPNPTDAFLTIQLENPKQEVVTFSVYNTLGQMVFSEKTPASTVEKRINTEGWSSGSYLLKIDAGQVVETVRFFKK